ncbi:MAG: hypothetical protein RLZZ618_1433 [Pseudomonadota bacterium]|jgi:hypothetical protein
MDSQESRQFTVPLARRVGEGASPSQIAAALVAIWREIDTALTPILGQRGVAALFGRSLHLAAVSHGWFADARSTLPITMDFDALLAATARQTPAEAMAGGAQLLQTFHGLLATLVGGSLTDRLLRSAWDNSSSSAPAQDLPS